MHIDLRDERRQRLFAMDVDLTDPPAIVQAPDGSGPTVHLDWDRALDDEKHLRHCPVCGCRDLFVRKPMPQVTAFVLVLLAGAVAMLLYGQANPIASLIVFALVAAVDISIYLFTRRELVCYRCRSVFSGMPIRRDHARWDRAYAEKYVLPDAPKEKGSAKSEAAPDAEPDDAEREAADSTNASPADKTDRQRNGANTP